MARRDPEKRRNAILEAAQKCFIRRGYHQTSMDDIVRESSSSKGTLYWHFKNKQELFVELFDRAISEITAPMQIASSKPLTASEKLRQMTANLEMEERTPELFNAPMRFLIELWEDEVFWKHFKSAVGTFVIQVEAVINEGIESGEFRKVDAGELAWGLMALIDGLFMYYATGLIHNLSHRISNLMALIIAGLQKAKTSR